MSAFANAGQICLSLQRLYLHRSIAAPFTAGLIEKTKGLRVGNPLDRECDVGPMISEEEALRAESWVHEAVKGGAKILCGGKREGKLCQPTILASVRPPMDVICKEIFASVVSIIE